MTHASSIRGADFIMADEKMETIYGRTRKYEIYREWGGFLSSTKFYIYCDGKRMGGWFSTLSAAVQAARKLA